MGNFNYKVFNVHKEKELYFIAQKWWQERGWVETPVFNLSTTGVMVFDNEEPICAGWLFQTDCDMALIGSVISGKKVGKKKKDALKALFVCLENIAKTMGFQSIFFPVTTNSIARLAEKDLNYINTKQKANELIKFI